LEAPFSFDWLIHPLVPGQFFEEYWEKEPVVVRRNEPDYFTRLLSFAEVDRVLTTLDRRYPDVCLKNAARPVSADEYTGPGGVLDVAKLCELFKEGSTITLAYLDTVLPALTLFCRMLERQFSCPFQTNVYMTPAGAQGAKPHYDTHDVFVLQVSGSKRWTIFGTPVQLPLSGQDFDASVHPLGAPTLEFEMKAGDVAYIPRGAAHEAKSADSVSLHITAGILRYTWADFLLEFLAGASLGNPVFRKSLPPGFAQSGFDRSSAKQILLDLLQEASKGSNFDATFDYFIDRFLSACPPLVEGQLNQLATLDHLSVASVVGVRPGAIMRAEAQGDSERVECYGRAITFPSRVREALRFALTHSRFAIRDLPGNLDDSSKLILIRRLIREGLVAALSESVGHS